MSCSISENQKRLDAALARIAEQPELAAQLADYYRTKGKRGNKVHYTGA